MKKLLLLFSAITFITCTISSAQKTDTIGNSLLWRISSKDMNKPSYLFGTIHLICPTDYIWTKKMEECFKKCDEVCFEMDLADPRVMMQIATWMIDKDKKLKDYFTEDQYRIIQHYFKDSLGIDITMFQFQQVKPVMLESLLALKTVSCPNPVAYEDKLKSKAIKNKKKVAGLEDPQEQIALLENIPIDTVVKELLESTQGKSNDQEEYETLIKAYKKQDLSKLYSLIQASKSDGDNLDEFIDERNEKWIGRMEERMEQKSVFFAVGAGHLWGEKGVINLLRQEGYTVEPVK
ncbi:MAG TPA: TraB/GumN family protein [Flavipsychrobacter sp.]|nr:TraB/GumN family protein [Flavipsychrobacter sp.]